MSWDVPNYFTLIAEIAVAILLATYFYKIQSKSNKKIESSTEEIRETLNQSIKLYIDEQKNLFKTRKRYYLNKIKESLEHIKKKDDEAKNIITDFRENPKNPDPDTYFKLNQTKFELKTMCANAEAYLEFLVPYLNNPQIAEEIMDYLPVLYAPYEYLTEEPYWMQSKFRVEAADSLIDIHLPEINKYIELLSKEEPEITNSRVTKSPS